MKKYNGVSIRQVRTDISKLPDGVGCCSPSGGGFVRKLTVQDKRQQKKNLATLNLAGR